MDRQRLLTLRSITLGVERGVHRVDTRDQCVSTRVVEHGERRRQHVVSDLLRPIERCALLIGGRGDVVGPAE